MSTPEEEAAARREALTQGMTLGLGSLPVVGPGLSMAATGYQLTRPDIAGPAEPPQPDVTEPANLENVPTTPDAGGIRIDNPELVAPTKGAGPGKANFTLKGDIPAGVSPDVAAAIGSRQDRIHQAEVLTQLEEMKAMGATEDAMREYNWVAQQDEAYARNIAVTHFTRAKAQLQDLNDAVDQARRLQVNPYHWQQSIGRGGRTAAAFAALTGGFAAGKTNPNSALALLDAAVERDISAQKSNITNTFEALRMKSDLGVQERQLFDEEMNNIQKLRAMNYAQILGRINLAKQNAITESARLGFQVAEDHYQLKLLQELAAVQQRILHIEVNAPIRGGVQQLQALKAQAEQLRQVLQPGMAGGQTAALGQVTNSEGMTAQDAMQAAGTTRQEVPIQGQAPAPAPAPGRAAGVAGRTRRPTQGPGAGEAPTSPEEQGPGEGAAEPQYIEDAETGMSRLETPEEVQARTAKAEAVAAAPTGPARSVADAEAKILAGTLTPQDATALVKNDPQFVGNPEVLPLRSFSRLYSQKKGGSGIGITTWDEALNAIGQGAQIPAKGVTGNEDAKVVAKYAPVPNPKFFPGGASNPQYQVLARMREYAEDYPEVYEKASSIGGERNAVHTPRGIYLVRAEARGDQKAYNKVVAETIKADRLSSDAWQTAKEIETHGLRGLFDEEGRFVIPGITTSDEASKQLFTMSIAQAMNFIKTHDPTARISDQDLKVGQKAAASYASGGNAFIDFAQRFFGLDLTQSEQAANFLRAMAVGAQKIAMAENYNVLVPSYESAREYGKRAEQVGNFMRGSKAWDGQ